MSSVHPNAGSSSAQEGFLFVQALAVELSTGEVDLPGFPEVLVRIRHALADENVSIERLARIIGAEPVLAARLLQMANSAALNLSGQQVTELRTAIARMGLNLVRSTTIAHAVRQLKAAPALQGLEKPLEMLWHRSVLVASLCYVLARRHAPVGADIALLAGLMHGIGRLYILTRASQHRSLFADVASYQAIERDWHLGIAIAILENWKMPAEVIQAVRDSEDFARESRGAPTLSDVLVAASLIAVHHDQPQMLDARLQSVRPVARLELTRAICDSLVEESKEELRALSEALA
ncbi:MAG TPA: HDOD domain-containing protein [Steroidobacteraceae bacterium]|nr:HDOD domain-containing protein [Steroidobacteraceae bacterium]